MSRRPIARTLAVAAVSIGLLAAVRSASAQSASMVVTTDVTDILISIANLQDLQFGTVVPGTPVHIDPKTSASAAKFIIHGAKRAEFSLAFTLPTLLRTGAGPHTMPLTFATTDACGRNQDQQSNCATFDPSAGLIDRVRNQNPPNNQYYVWLGGTAAPAAGQFPGVYTATVTATVAYTGN